MKKYTRNQLEQMGVKVTTRTVTTDPITIEATATYLAPGGQIAASYNGDESETRKEVKGGALLALRMKCSKSGLYPFGSFCPYSAR